MISVGLVGKSSFLVEQHMLAAKVGSGSVQAFSTPFLVALAEQAACNALTGLLEPGMTSVGQAFLIFFVSRLFAERMKLKGPVLL